MASAKSSKFVKYTWLIIWLPVILVSFLLLLISFELFFDLPSVEELQNPKSIVAI
jgi:hypothetical protein